ncbi:hypothetical protein CP532_6660 [Ophiocordyceps camponoti-leonardi (nom. inval.)]|nr:hypothetical protein CP532_6660 [Ophiocordyceps camponoti-leonardi (nom. inval.)]
MRFFVYAIVVGFAARTVYSHHHQSTTHALEEHSSDSHHVHDSQLPQEEHVPMTSGNRGRTKPKRRLDIRLVPRATLHTLGLESGTQYAGYLDDNENDKHLFFWFFESRNDPENDPVILWLNGGPGAASIPAIINELGPALLGGEKGSRVRRNPWSANNNASLLFIDQPVNTGFSYGGKSVNTTEAASQDFYRLLTLFFNRFPQYQRQDFHMAGHSYAGRFIPIFALDILSHADRNINLKSIMLGNPHTDPLTLFKSMEPMACGQGGRPAVLNASQCAALRTDMRPCLDLVKTCYDTNVCGDPTEACGKALHSHFDRDELDVRNKDPLATARRLLLQARYFNDTAVRWLLSSNVHSFVYSNATTWQAFYNTSDWMKPTQHYLREVLESIPVIVYAGDADYICNWLGNRVMTDELAWRGHDAFNNADTKALRLAGTGSVYGTIKAARNLAFGRIFDAGHIVPINQPQAYLDLLNRWTRGEWFEKRSVGAKVPMSCVCGSLPWRFFVQSLIRVHGLESSRFLGTARTVPWPVKTPFQQRAFHLLQGPKLYEASTTTKEEPRTSTTPKVRGTSPKTPSAAVSTSSDRPRVIRSQNADGKSNFRKKEGDRHDRNVSSRRTDSATPPSKSRSGSVTDKQRRAEASAGERDRTGPPWEKPKKERWMIQKEALKEKFPEGWKPRKRLSPDALTGIRALHAQFPDIYTTPALAERFKVSPEAIRRILKSNFRPSEEQEEARRERWERRGLQVWERKAALGIKPPRKWREMGIARDPSHHDRAMRSSKWEKQMEEEEIRTYQKQYLERRAREQKGSGEASGT